MSGNNIQILNYNHNIVDIGSDNKVVITDQIKSNHINYILTNKGERIFNLNFGSSIRQTLFENINEDTLFSLQSNITEDIKSNFPSIKILQLSLTPDFDKNTINMTLSYSIYNGPADFVQITL